MEYRLSAVGSGRRLAVSGEPAAFMSYARFNDAHDDGQLSAFRERLAAEVRAQTGREFVIFQDRADIVWGQNWQRRIMETLDVVTLLLVVVTPGFFGSAACRAEVARFLQREEELGRSDLILPVYYISAREMDDPAVRESDEMARVLASRQFADWRELRFEPFTSPLARKAIAQLASQMRETFWQQAEAVTGPTERAGTEDQVTARSESLTYVGDALRRKPLNGPPPGGPSVLVSVLSGHTGRGWYNGGIPAMAFSPDGNLLASGGGDQTIRIWKMATGTPVRTLTGHEWGVKSVAFSPDGNLLASGGHDQTIRIWETATGTPVRTLTGHNRAVNSVAFSPDGTLLASGGDDKTIRIWETATGTPVRTLTGQKHPVNSVAFSPDGTLLASAGDYRSVRIWETATGTLVRALIGHTGRPGWSEVRAVAFSRDGNLLASAGYDKTVRIWEAATGVPVRTLTGHTGGLQAVVFSPDGNLLASAGEDQIVRLWG